MKELINTIICGDCVEGGGLESEKLYGYIYWMVKRRACR